MQFAQIAKRLGNDILAWRALTMAPLEAPVFRALWIAALASNFGTVIQTVGAAWMMTTLHHSPLAVALVQTAALAPFILLSLPAGALADNLDRRIVMLVSQLIGLVSALSLALLAFADLVTPVILLTFTALIGCATAVHQPAWQASFAHLVPRAALPAAVGLNSLAFNIARSTGPALGGVLVAVAGPASTFALNAVSFVALVAVLATQRLPPAPRTTPPESAGAAMAAGLRYVAMAPQLRATLLRGALYGFGAGALWSLSPLIAQSQLDGASIVYGLLLAGFGVGSLGGALSSASLQHRFGAGATMRIAVLTSAIATLGVGLSTALPLSIMFMAIGGFGWIAAQTTLNSSIQLGSPRWVVGRAIGLGRVAALGALAAGAAAAGLLAQHAGIVATYVSSAIFLFGLAMLRLGGLADQSTDDFALKTYEVNPPSVALTNSTGPIAVIVDYRVPLGEAPAFLATLHALGRIRRRDGARNWSISQDIDDPQHWIEHFESATWVDHLRLAGRAIEADEGVRERARAYRLNRARRFSRRPPSAEPLQ